MRPASAHLGLSLLLAASLALGGCDSIRSVFARGEGSSQGASQGSDASASAVAALDSDREAAAPTGDPVPTRGERQVEFPVVAESVASELGMDPAAFAGATVPVLAPAAMSTEQADSFEDSYRATPDGYFARMAMNGYDVVVNGTRVFAVAPEAAGAPPARDTSEIQYSETDTGASVTFNRFGADYSIEFVCRGPGGEPSCVSEAQATEFVERLVPVGGGGQ
jgi:hypothetical protein